MTVYVLMRDKGFLDALVFGSLSDAKQWARVRYPFSSKWESSRPRHWTGNKGGVIYSCKLQAKGDPHGCI